MKYIKIIGLLLVMAFGWQAGQAQILKPARWSYEVSSKEVKVGEEVELVFNVNIMPDWYLYSSDFDPDLGPMVTTFTFQKDPSYALVGKIKPINPKKKYDKIFDGEYTYFIKNAQFRQRIKVLSPNLNIKGAYEYQVCSDVDGKCIPFDDTFTFNQISVSGVAQPEPAAPAVGTTTPTEAPVINNQTPRPAEETGILMDDPTFQGLIAEVDSARVDSTRKAGTLAVSPADTNLPATAETAPLLAVGSVPNAGSDLSSFMVLAFFTGLLALLTPCVFPMVPMTVSFFTGNSNNRAQAIFKAFIYGLSIVVIYTLIGTIFSKLAGPEAANFISTHWLPNILFFLVFLLFGMSFLGMFEITLPSSLVNKADAQADKGGWYGVFFMAFTLVLVSFSCTGPLVGSILVSSAGGETLKPIAGMLAYSTAFALPFTLFAAFPSWLKSLPRSGGWLNSIKVCLGFIELALALKFLSMADQAYHWGLLDRDIYIAIWIVLFTLMGFYLLGKLKFSHDSDLKFISVPRILLAILVFSFVVYLIPGLFGAPLKGLAGYLPPQSSHDFDLNAIIRQNNQGGAVTNAPANELCEKPKYADFLHLPHGLQGYFDLEQAKRCATAQNKPIFIDFTGHACVNCREMEANVWSDPEVLKRLQNDYVVVALYVDDKAELPQDEWYVSTYDKKEKRTIGKKNADYQITRFQNNAQPFYILMDPATEKPLVQPMAYNLNVQEFANFLDAGKKQYQQKMATNGNISALK
ncbi:thiol:disulfide interchange protein [Adhaeribacter aerolatus]|uniref:Thiol:disulfide interchange protein n=1 Tax=Adhaeribacter aerolatus TaxID=670289 RepID=A0A512B342_9BACT|nr:cytochrome c biogenesis protein CcdA [Adhaeribacter aerolatus]GEO06385.1 thiol:disulfide interchange protein [Adhaeribacter aerolatus]